MLLSIQEGVIKRTTVSPENKYDNMNLVASWVPSGKLQANAQWSHTTELLTD